MKTIHTVLILASVLALSACGPAPAEWGAPKPPAVYPTPVSGPNWAR